MAWLFADRSPLAHQKSKLGVTGDSALFADYVFCCSAGDRRSALDKQLVYRGLQSQTLGICVDPPLAVFVLAGTANLERN